MAVFDISESFARLNLWWMLGFNDLKARYRGSVLGPIWITIALGVTVGGIAVLYSGLLHTKIDTFAPYIAISLTIWALIQTSLVEASSVFVVAANVIKQTALPKSGHVLRLVFRNLLIFAHNFVIVVFVMVLFKVKVSLFSLLAIPGFLLLLFNLTWMSLIISSLSSRYKDVPQIVLNAMTFITIMTPVYWQPNMIPGREWVLHVNPFYYLLEIVRKPILGELVDIQIWLVVLVMSAIGSILSLSLFAQMRGKIVHWI